MLCMSLSLRESDDLFVLRVRVIALRESIGEEVKCSHYFKSGGGGGGGRAEHGGNTCLYVSYR